ncbi:MAG: hypothetical protein E5V29_03430 [Mesorhizobium sp.]|nr:MAG: hypothetical protein E5V29_03430 [Mesorhizobium sp.]
MKMTFKLKKEAKMSRSLLEGIGRGFSASAEFTRSFSVHRDRRFEPTIDKAWKDVGGALSSATREVVKQNEQKTGKSSSATRIEQARKPRHRIAG